MDNPKRISEIEEILSAAYHRWEKKDFIENDPVQAVHWFQNPEDQAIAGLLAATLAWGKRSMILEKLNDLMIRLEWDPHGFVLSTQKQKYKALKGFGYRTFMESDAIAFFKVLSQLYQSGNNLESLFNHSASPQIWNPWLGIQSFRMYFSSVPGVPLRTLKHIADPDKGSAAKRLHLFLRWMVREDQIDVGIWNHLPKSQLICPLDVHTGRVARQLGILHRNANDKKSAEEVTDFLRMITPEDPVKWDVALFGLGLEFTYPSLKLS